MKNIFSEISTLILCGGFGKRLRPIVSDRQKALADIMGNPFITFILDQISNAGGEDVILCTGFMSGQVKNLLGDRYKTLYLRYSEENEPLGTAGAVRNAAGMVKSDAIMIFNGDSYCNINPQTLLEWHTAIKASCTLLLVQVPDVSRYGCVNFDSSYMITSFDEKKANKGSGWINSGIYCINRELIASMQEKKNISFEKDFFPKMIGNGLFAFPQDAEFIDIGTPDSYKEAENFFKKVKRFTKAEKFGSNEQ
ncbi:MAG: nucleotidyltransferase family protein [bacterium]